MNKTFLSATLALAVIALAGCGKKAPASNPTTTASASKNCAMKADGQSCSKKDGELASAKAAHDGCPHADGDACDHEAGAKAGRECCMAHMASASSAPAAVETK